MPFGRSNHGIPLRVWTAGFLGSLIAMILLRSLEIAPRVVHVEHLIEKLENIVGPWLTQPVDTSFVAQGHDEDYSNIATTFVYSMYTACGLIAASAVAVAAASTYNMAGMLEYEAAEVDADEAAATGQATSAIDLTNGATAPGQTTGRSTESDDRVSTARHLSVVLWAIALSYLCNASMGRFSFTVTAGDPHSIRWVPIPTYIRYLFSVPAVNAVVTEVVESHAELLARRRSLSASPRPPRPEPRIPLWNAVIHMVISTIFLAGRFLPALSILAGALWMVYGLRLYLIAYQPVRGPAAMASTHMDSSFESLSARAVSKAYSGDRPQQPSAGRAATQHAGGTPHRTTQGTLPATVPGMQLARMECECGHFHSCMAFDAMNRIRSLGKTVMNIATLLELTGQLAPWAVVRGIASSLIMIFAMAGVVMLPFAYVQYRLLALTEGAVLEERLAAVQAHEEAQEAANEARRRFLRYVMHEARVPANAIRLGLDSLALEADDMPEDAQEVVEEMREAAAAQAALFNSVLSLAKLESSHFTLSKERARVEDVLNRCNRTVAPCAAAAGARVTLHVEDAARHTLVSMDTARIEQVVANFMANAVKCLPKDGSGYVTVLAACGRGRASQDAAGRAPTGQGTGQVAQARVHGQQHRHSTCEGWLRVDVIDNGPGIPVGEQAKIFEPYVQIAGANKTIEGTGLGLTIDKHIIEAHDGRIGFTSEEGQGSNFWFELPVTPEPAVASGSWSTEVADVSAEGTVGPQPLKRSGSAPTLDTGASFASGWTVDTVGRRIECEAGPGPARTTPGHEPHEDHNRAKCEGGVSRHHYPDAAGGPTPSVDTSAALPPAFAKRSARHSASARHSPREPWHEDQREGQGTPSPRLLQLESLYTQVPDIPYTAQSTAEG